MTRIVPVESFVKAEIRYINYKDKQYYWASISLADGITGLDFPKYKQSYIDVRAKTITN